MTPQPSQSIWRVHTLAVLTFTCVVGAGKTEWARVLFGVARHDAWITVLISMLLGGVAGTMVVWAVTLYPHAPAGGLLKHGFGSWLGGFLSVGFGLYAVAEAARTSRTAVELLHFAVLPRTPSWVILLVAMLISAVVLLGGLESLLHFQYILVWPTVLLVSVALALGFQSADWGNFLPVLAEGFAPVIWGMKSMIEPLLGLELLLIYLPHFLRRGVAAHMAPRAAWLGMTGVLLWYLYATVTLLVGFGPYEVAEMTWPVMEAVRRTFLSGLFFERLDILFLVGLLIATTTALNSYAYAALETLRQTFSMRPRAWQVWICVAAVWGVALLPKNMAELDRMRVSFIEPVGLVYLVLVPALLIAMALLRRFRGRSHEVTS